MGLIPERWLEYIGTGKPIEGVPIVAFKTPLSERYHRPRNCKDETSAYLEKDEEFTPDLLCQKMSDLGFEFAVIIDLTFTFRYYNGIHEFWEKHEVQYEKVKCEGQRLPHERVLNRVFEIMNDVIYQHGKDSKKVVGIHCTHGVNRTGYIVCRYLIDWLGFTPEKAIEAFNVSRGHDMERSEYIEELKKRTPKNRFDEWKRRRELMEKGDGELDYQDFGDVVNDFENFNEHDVIEKNFTQNDPQQDQNYDYSPWHYQQSDKYYDRMYRSPHRRFTHRHAPYNRWKNGNIRTSDDSMFQQDEFLPTSDKFIAERYSNSQIQTEPEPIVALQVKEIGTNSDQSKSPAQHDNSANGAEPKASKATSS